MIPTGSNPQSSVDVWNSVAPVGTPVRYWVGREPRQALTTSRALVVDGVASVRVSGRAFPVALSHVSLVCDGGAA
jgi:hypothetical protein